MKSPRDPAQRGRWIVGGLGIAAGLGLVVLGVSTQWWIGVAGFVVMVAAAAYALATPRRPVLGTVAHDGSIRPAARAARPQRSQSGLMARLEARWETRRQRDQRW